MVQAFKKPYHRQLLRYTGRGAIKNEPRYFGYDNKHHLVLNMVDADSARFLDDRMIKKSVNYCNNGLSKSKHFLFIAIKVNLEPNHFLYWFKDKGMV